MVVVMVSMVMVSMVMMVIVLMVHHGPQVATSSVAAPTDHLIGM